MINYKKNHKKEYEHTKANITKIKNDFNAIQKILKKH